MTQPIAEAPLAQKATADDKAIQTWKERIRRAREARKPFEKIWLSNLAFAAGQHWLVWDDHAGQMRHLQDVDPRQQHRVLYTADRINEFLQAQYGELNSDSDRPDLLTAVDGDTAEQIAKELNDAVAHGWDHEWKAAEALQRARQYTLIMGFSAARMRRDPNCGPVVDRQPMGADGSPITDNTALDMLEQHGMLPDGSLPKFQQIHEGRSVIDAYTPFQVLTPPGITHEDDFPWEVLVRPVPLEALKDEYGAAAAGLVEDTDIASAAGLSTGQSIGAQSNGIGTAGNARLREHCWLYTCFRRPCRQYPNGQQVILAGNQYTLLDQSDLQYKTADGTPHSGVVYFHWWRLADRFQSRSFIEPLKDPQRLINEMETLNAETIQRGQSKVFMQKSSVPEMPAGVPMEVVVMPDGATEPHFFAGTGPGDWMWKALDQAAQNLTHASTLSPLRLGENPPNIDTYSQLFLVNENEGRKRDMIISDHERQRNRLVEFGVHDIREWWPSEKLITVAGDEGQISRVTFEKSKVPDFFVVKTATGAAAPRSQAAEIKKIDAIWAAAAASGVVLQDPYTWTKWYADSLSAGEALDLPEVQKDSQEQFADFENFLMGRGEDVPPADYDLLPVHLPIHREAQDHARASGDMELYQRIQRHIDASEAMAQINAMQVAQAAQAAGATAGPPTLAPPQENDLQPPPGPPAAP